jgi:hypothetical protein
MEKCFPKLAACLQAGREISDSVWFVILKGEEGWCLACLVSGSGHKPVPDTSLA